MKAKTNQRYSREQEQRIARLLGGRRHAYSGSRAGEDGDGHVGDDATSLDYILLECKRTNGSKQITLKEADLRKHQQESMQLGREPVLAFELDGKDYAVVDVHYLSALLDAVRHVHEWGKPVYVGSNEGTAHYVQQCLSDDDCQEMHEIAVQKWERSREE